MKPAGCILTFMGREDWIGKTWWIKLRTLFFNCKLFVFQLMFMVIATVYGKIKWPGWRRVWRAAQCSHVRLCLRKIPEPEDSTCYEYMNFGWEFAELQYWRMDQCDGKRFEYRPPAFEPSDEFVAAMIEYAEKQVGKGYDDLQLISSGLHLIAWIVWPWWWGKELRIIKALNRKGGREFCSSGFTADLRWAEAHSNNMRFKTFFDTDYFPGYDTPVVPPGLVALSEDWEEK